MAKAKFDIKIEATRPLYAGVGVADRAVEVVRDYVADVQKRLTGVRHDVETRLEDVQKSVKKVDLEPDALRKQVTTAFNERVDAITKEAKVRRKAIEARVAELQDEAREIPTRMQTALEENVSTVGDTYADLAKRGETLVARIRRQQSTKATVTSAKTTTAKAKTTRTQSAKATKSTATTAKKTTKSAAKKTTGTAKKATSTPRSSAKATTTAAKKTAAAATEAATDAAKKVGD
ncbi:hypothetical protein [Nocardioides ferulae]|uniref:hypothetical protein n=1 Tax=Nocardioides ferulae TaxID=2340821 RepID=UPI001980E3A6|nr:hypothetical protein [Nocardioides ferulae]